jgi:hypothetical protein
MSTREILRPVMMLARRTMATMAKYTCVKQSTLIKKKEKDFPHIQYKEIQKGAVAKSLND